MAPPVSLELRERIIAWKYELNMPISVIAQLANQCEKTVKNVLKTYRDYNQPTSPFIRPRGRKRILDRDDLNYIESILLVEPALFLDEIQDKLHAVRDVKVSISTHSCTLNCLAITHKAVAKEAMEQNEHLHDTWQVVMAQYDACQLVFVDKAEE
jgi:transposase